MLQDVDDMEVSCVIHVKYGTSDQPEQSKICVLTVTNVGIVMLSVQHNSEHSVCFMEHPRDLLWQISLDVLSVGEFPDYIWQTSEVSCCSHLYITVNTHTASARLSANHWMVWQCATCGIMQQDSSLVELASWLLLILFWLEAYYLFLKTSHFFSLLSSTTHPLKQIMATHTAQPGERGSESSETSDSSCNTSLPGTQQHPRHKLVHCHPANAATVNMTQAAHLYMVRKTGSNKNK